MSVRVLRYSLNTIWSLLKWSWRCARPKEPKQKGNKRGGEEVGRRGVEMQTVGGERRAAGEGGSKLTSFAPSLVYHSCPLAVIPSGGVSGCVRPEGPVGYGNPPPPQSCPTMSCDTLSNQPLCSGKPPGSVLSPLLINVQVYCNLKFSSYSE